MSEHDEQEVENNDEDEVVEKPQKKNKDKKQSKKEKPSKKEVVKKTVAKKDKAKKQTKKVVSKKAKKTNSEQHRFHLANILPETHERIMAIKDKTGLKVYEIVEQAVKAFKPKA